MRAEEPRFITGTARRICFERVVRRALAATVVAYSDGRRAEDAECLRTMFTRLMACVHTVRTLPPTAAISSRPGRQSQNYATQPVSLRYLNPDKLQAPARYIGVIPPTSSSATPAANSGGSTNRDEGIAAIAPLVHPSRGGSRGKTFVSKAFDL